MNKRSYITIIDITNHIEFVIAEFGSNYYEFLDFFSSNFETFMKLVPFYLCTFVVECEEGVSIECDKGHKKSIMQLNDGDQSNFHFHTFYRVRWFWVTTSKWQIETYISNVLLKAFSLHQNPFRWKFCISYSF